jgi:two-component system, NarL family, nitrate/nitrite response regulator NarL
MRIVVVSRVRLYREGLVLLLGARAGLEVTGAADDAPAAVALVATARPDVAIVDSGMIMASGVVLSMRRASAVTRVVAFGVSDEPAEIIACAEAGVAGYVPIRAGTGELVAVLEAVQRDELSCTPIVAGALLRRVTELSATVPHPAAGTLTGRESEILALVGEGLMNKQIARRLGISLSTVKNHVHRILQKEAVPSRDALIRRAGVDAGRA